MDEMYASEYLMFDKHMVSLAGYLIQESSLDGSMNH